MLLIVRRNVLTPIRSPCCAVVYSAVTSSAVELSAVGLSAVDVGRQEKFFQGYQPAMVFMKGPATDNEDNKKPAIKVEPTSLSPDARQGASR